MGASWEWRTSKVASESQYPTRSKTVFASSVDVDGRPVTA